MPKAVLHLLGTAEVGGTGICRIVAELARGLDPAKYHVHAWFLGPDGPLAQELQIAGATVRQIYWPDGVRDPIGAWHFFQRLRNQDFAIVHQHIGARLLRRVIRAGSDAPIVSHIHAEILPSTSTDSIPAAVRGADAVIVASHAIARQLEPVSSIVVHAGVPLSGGVGFEPTRCQTNIVIGTACRLVASKGLLDLIQAVAVLYREFPQLRLEIAGEGPQHDALIRECQILGVEESVRFLGWEPNIGSRMRTWDVFVLPSREEGFGLAVLEAMAEGLPVVGTSVGGLPEIIEDGKTGFTVPPSDTAALVKYLRLLVLDPQRRIEMGAAARDRAVACFSADRMVAQIAGIYDGLCGDTP